MPARVIVRSGGVVLLAAASLIMSGCGDGAGGSLLLPVTPKVIQAGGKTMGGELPIIGATVTLYSSAANTGIANGAYTGTATVLASTTSGAGGSFSFSGVTGCSTNQLVYITASGGNNGAGTNANTLTAAVLGFPTNTSCAGLPAFTNVDEVTTVATAYAFSSFISLSGTNNTVLNITAPANNNSLATTNDVSQGTVTTASGLLHAYQNAINLANMATGTAYTAPPTNSNAIAPAAVVNTLANILQYCVNSTGGTSGDSSPCGNLFANSLSLSAAAPTTTLQAALNLARNPAPSATALFAFAPGTGAAPFLPVLSAAPKDWTLAIAYPVPPNPIGGIGFPFTLALDADDNVYVTSPENDPWLPNTGTSTGNSQSSCLFGWTSNGTFRPTITPYVGTPDVAPQTGTGQAPGTGTPGTSSWFCSGVQDAALPSSTDTQADYALANIAADNVGNVWLANYTKSTAGFNHLVKVSTSATLNPGFPAGTWELNEIAINTFLPVGLAVDKFNNVWTNVLTGTSGAENIFAYAAGPGNTAAGTALLTIGSVTTAPTFASAGRGLAFDSLGNFFGASYGGSSGALGAQSLGGTAFFMPLTGAQSAANYNCSGTLCTTADVFKKALGGSSTSGSVGNNAPWGVAVDSSNNTWYTAGGALGQTLTSGVVNGLFECVSTFTSGLISAETCSTINSTVLTTPKFLEADGNNVLWIADSTGIAAYASTLGTPAFISEAGGFKPCIPGTGTTAACTYPDFTTQIKGIAVDSTGSVWWTTPDITPSNTNANMLYQMIGTGTSAWPLMATQKPGVMPQ